MRSRALMMVSLPAIALLVLSVASPATATALDTLSQMEGGGDIDSCAKVLKVESFSQPVAVVSPWAFVPDEDGAVTSRDGFDLELVVDVHFFYYDWQGILPDGRHLYWISGFSGSGCNAVAIRLADCALNLGNPLDCPLLTEELPAWLLGVVSGILQKLPRGPVIHLDPTRE